MCIKVLGVADRGFQPEPERKSLTLEYINTSTQKTSGPMPTQMVLQQKPPEMGEVACTSGTMMEKNTLPWPQKKHSTNFKAEAEALKKAAVDIRNNLLRTKPNAVIFTDALSLSLSVLKKTPKSPPERSQRGENCPGRPRSPDKPNSAVDSSTPRDPRK